MITSNFRYELNVRRVLVPVLVGLLLFVVIAMGTVGFWRFTFIRTKGTPTVMRTLPAKSLRAWRHGSLRYTGSALYFYKLRSFKPGADETLDRTQVSFEGFRRVEDEEKQLLPEDFVIIQVGCEGKTYDFALENRPGKALISWIESAPSARQQRMDFQQLRSKAAKTHKR